VQALDRPAHCFFGHKDVILDFDFRRDFEGGGEHQLVHFDHFMLTECFILSLDILVERSNVETVEGGL